MIQRVYFFIDGFNVYHSIADDRNLSKYKWINYFNLCSSLISSKQQITGIDLFTAYYPGKPDRRQRHSDFIKVQQSNNIKLVFGEFKERTRWCPTCRKHFKHHEEKQTDVNIAIELLRKAVEDLYDTAFIMSGDSDLIPAIRAVKQTFPSKKVHLVFPPNRTSEALKLEADYYMRLKEKHLKNNQLDHEVSIAGKIISKPPEW